MASQGSTLQTATSLNDLRTALRELKPAGAEGFEGLLAVIFSKIAQVDFRLAKSGLQGGKDGSTSGSDISFEAKRYDGDIPKNEVLSKITQLIGSSTRPRLWVLGATVEVGAQLVDAIEAAVTQTGLGLLILDWPDASLVPPLAVACAMAPQEVSSFFNARIEDANIVKAANKALALLASLDGFDARAAALERQLRTPTLGVANARQANTRWLTLAFTDRTRARSIFGQALAPGATHAMPTQDRQALVDEVTAKLSSATAPTIVAILGREGHGKSWLFAQTWCSVAQPPLTLLLPASTFKSVTAYGEIGALLIGKFIEQTGGEISDDERRRWKAQLGGWGARGVDEPPRFIVCVDGLNERPDIDWPRWLEGASSWIAERGGLLVVTAREAYFNDRVRPSLLSPVEAISVSEWTDAELKSILAKRGIDPGKLSPEVFQRLRNPRLLGIAFELLNNSQVETFTELTVDHLLFEHIRASARAGNAPEPVDQFVKRLADHAREIIARVQRQKIEDRLVFEQDTGGASRYELTPDLIAVTAEHFFKPLAEDPTLYTLSDDGLALAFGLAIIKALQVSERAQRDIVETLDALLDPIEALDKTAEAVFSAVLVASVDTRCSIAIQQALIGRVLKLQNLDQSRYAAFVAVVRNVPDATMGALYDLAGTDDRVASQDWLIRALRECRHRPSCWEAISAHLHRWLRTYSLDPKLGVWASHGSEPEKVAKDVEERTERLRQREQAFSTAEAALIATMHEVTIDPGQLHGPALELLAGMPLLPFADDLVACAFSISFNSPISNAYDEFVQLIRFNRLDWAEAREALLNAAAFSRAPEGSKTAKWTLVQLLRATCTPADAEEEHALIEILTADRPKYGGWRRIETYCATDPCDPDAARPDNIDETAERYAQLNIDDLNRGLWMGEADHFLDDARPGLARFAPDAAIGVHQRLAQSLKGRSALSARLALSELKPHAAIIDADGLASLQNLVVEHAKPYDGKARGDDRESWLVSQIALQLALPHLDGEQQAVLLDRLPDLGPSFLDLQDVFRPSSPESAERLLVNAVQSGDRNRILLALSYVRGSGVELGPNVRRSLAGLVPNEDGTVRGFAMALALSVKDRATIEGLVQRGWSASALDPNEHFYEIWYGSHLLIHAVELGLLDRNELLGRISPKLFGAAASVLPPKALANALHQAIGRLVTHPIMLRPPAVEQEVPASSETPAYLSLVDKKEDASGFEAFAKRLSETTEDFDSRQRAGWKSFHEFEHQLTKDQARLAIENVGLKAIEGFVSAAPAMATELGRSILQQPAGQMHSVVNFGLMLARALSFQNPPLAVELFRHLAPEEPFVRLVFGAAKVSLDAICLWGSADGPEVEQLRRSRLDSAANDQELAQEVLAALQEGKAEQLREYAEAKLSSEVPAEVARGLMTFGLGDESEAAQSAIRRHEQTKGFIGEAAKAAKFAYDRNRWARHWFAQMNAAETPKDFWRASVQFLKIVDGRVALWASAIERKEIAQRFAPLLKSAMKHRIEKWKPKREKTLLGGKTPSEIYTVLA